MSLIQIKVSSDWTLIQSDGEKRTLSVPLAERLTQLCQIIKDKDISGGTIDQETVFLYRNQQWDLAQYLTENTNRPFVYGQPDEFEEKAAQIPWQITYLGFTEGKEEYARESLLTVGNGFLGLRGTTPEMEITENTYPALYLAGLYDQAPSEVAGKTIYNEDFVNGPNLQKMYLIIDGEQLVIENDHILYMKRQLNLENGLFESWIKFKLSDGKKIMIHTEKIASMAHVQQYALRYTIQPLNFSASAVFVSEADGDVYNYNVARYRSLTRHHLNIKKLWAEKNQVTLDSQTRNSKININQQAKLRSSNVSFENLTIEKTATKILQKVPLQLQQGKTYTFEKTVIVNKTHENEASSLPIDFPDFNSCLQQSSRVWQTLWQQAKIKVDGDLMSQKLLNLHTYHLLTSASPKGNQGLDASVTARGLHGEAYRGHIFWDELFIFPFYVLHFPAMMKDLLLYRYHRLPQAKEAARRLGLKGAMFPWQSGLDGSEQSQQLHLNPLNGQWKPDNSQLQRHVSLAIAYNVWFYWHNTRDIDFMNQYGLEMLLEIACFWESMTEFDEKDQRYHIEHVMGPDEFHEAYPQARQGGFKDNSYTNIMVAWLFTQIGQLRKQWNTDDFDPIQIKVGLNDQSFKKMEDIRQRLALQINAEGVLAQFEGYFSLKDLDWDYYKKKYGNIYRMDRILNAEGKSADDYQLAKQPDTLMIFYNLSQTQVRQLVENLGYQLPQDYVRKNLTYYLQRTTHGSTLSRVVHTHLAAMIKNDKLAWKLYQESLYSDYRDIQGGTTAEGIHTGVMAATLYIPLITFAGIELRKDLIQFDPHLPQAWSGLQFSMSVRGTKFEISVSRETITITADRDTVIQIAQQKITLTAHQKAHIPYKGGNKK